MGLQECVLRSEENPLVVFEQLVMETGTSSQGEEEQCGEYLAGESAIGHGVGGATRC